MASINSRLEKLEHKIDNKRTNLFAEVMEDLLTDDTSTNDMTSEELEAAERFIKQWLG
jgi:hypothetical protein